MSLTDEKIQALVVLEILGKPADHVTETLKKIIDEIGEEKGVEIKEKKVNEPVPLKNKREFFTNFAEIEVELDSIRQLVLLMFKYMPAHINILSPENLLVTNNDLEELLNELVRRLHGYDEVTRIVQLEKKLLERKLKSLLDKEKVSEKTEESKDKEDKKG